MQIFRQKNAEKMRFFCGRTVVSRESDLGLRQVG